MTQRGMIIGIAGPTASGKTTVAKQLAAAHGAYRTKYSDVLIAAANAARPPLPTTKESLQWLSTELRQQNGESYLTDRLREMLQYVQNKVVVIEGNRRMVDMRFLVSLAEEEDKKLVLLYIDADPDTRFLRINSRLASEGHEPLSREAFDILEADECEEELPQVRAYIKRHGTVLDTTTLSPDEVARAVTSVVPPNTRKKHP